MRIRNLTNSPYALPTNDQGWVIVPSGDVMDVDLPEGYPLDDAFWAVEPDTPKRGKKTD